MSSRKKAKGQARKAAKVKKEVELLAEQARKVEEQFRGLELAQIQRLQGIIPSPAHCMHGFDPFSDDHICSKFIHAFVHEFYIWFRNLYIDGLEDERVIIDCLLKARESTKDEYSEVWDSSAKMKQVVSYFLHNGAMLILAGTAGYARHSAMFARFYEQWLKIEVHKRYCTIR